MYQTKAEKTVLRILAFKLSPPRLPVSINTLRGPSFRKLVRASPRRTSETLLEIEIRVEAGSIEAIMRKGLLGPEHIFGIHDREGQLKRWV